MGSRHTVNHGDVIVTSSGRLQQTHNVKAILHAAVVTGAPGRGFQAISDDLLIEATRNVLAKARQLAREETQSIRSRSLMMPLFGTGQGQLSPVKITERLLQEIIQDLAYHSKKLKKSDLTTVIFSVFTKEHVSLIHRLMEQNANESLLKITSQ
ncbi:MAG: macro domain-containing protein [Thiolinea sp.]